MRAIKQRPHAYLLRPIDPVVLFAVVCTVHRQSRVDARPNQEGILELHTLNETRFDPYMEVLHLASEGAFTRVHLASSRELVVSRNLGHLEALLPERTFFRCHRSHIVAIGHVRAMDRQDGGHLELTNGAFVPLTSRKNAQFEAFMRQ